ncbi:MAG: hypothetical protein LBB79_08480 [Prevotellaceae bacterium]|jgi:hypothetical protein|nr:hypothetical protein [Prevotellaceae bacterium]
MKKLPLLLLLLLLGVSIMPFLLNAANTSLVDTSLVRISSAETRANFLSRMMKERLELDPTEYAAIQAINIKYEELLQELVLNAIPSSSSAFGATKKKKSGDTPFDQLDEAREKEVKKVLSGKHYREYDKQRWGMRNTLKKQMLTEKEERNKQRAQLEKARADSIIAAEKVAEKAAEKVAEEKAVKKKTTAKKSKKSSSKKKKK